MTVLLSRWRAGDDRALEQLAAVVYGELHHMAGRYLRHEPAGQTLQTHDLIHEAPSPEERLLREEEVGRLLDAVATLGDADRELIGLRYGSSLDTAEVAQMLGISEGSVRTRLWRALGKLRGVLEP